MNALSVINPSWKGVSLLEPALIVSLRDMVSQWTLTASWPTLIWSRGLFLQDGEIMMKTHATGETQSYPPVALRWKTLVSSM